MQMFWNRAVGIGEVLGLPMLFPQAEQPAHEELGPALAAAQAPLSGFGGCARRCLSRPHALSPKEGNTTQTLV